MYKGTPKSGGSILLRSYDSRREPPPEFNCTIWQAGRATSAIGLAFKPIQIGQSVFLDEGIGKYNPSPQVLDEAAVNEWPGREVGILVSCGTGKRPAGTNNRQHEWWEGFVGGSMGDFAEARRRLIAKIEGCEETHQYMMKEHLAKRGVPLENYCRLNVEVGVGEFGMNEWNRLSDVSTNTRRYLSKNDVQKQVYDAAVKIAKIERSKRRVNRRAQGLPEDFPVPSNPPHPVTFELPGDEGPAHPQYRNPIPSSNTLHPRHERLSSQDKFAVIPSDEPAPPLSMPKISSDLPSRTSGDDQRDSTYGSAIGSVPSPRISGDFGHSNAPPLPPKTPISATGDYDLSTLPSPRRTGGLAGHPPYPDVDGPPPAVNKLRKPEYRPR